MHAILIMCQTHCLAGFVFAFGIRGGVKLPGWGERMYYTNSDYPISSSEDEFDRPTVRMYGIQKAFVQIVFQFQLKYFICK